MFLKLKVGNGKVPSDCLYGPCSSVRFWTIFTLITTHSTKTSNPFSRGMGPQKLKQENLSEKSLTPENGF